MDFLPCTIDFSKIESLIYHFPNGKVLRIEIKDIEQLAVLKHEVGNLCDTTHIDGKLHFYPRGNT